MSCVRAISAGSANYPLHVCRQLAIYSMQPVKKTWTIEWLQGVNSQLHCVLLLYKNIELRSTAALSYASIKNNNMKE